MLKIFLVRISHLKKLKSFGMLPKNVIAAWHAHLFATVYKLWSNLINELNVFHLLRRVKISVMLKLYQIANRSNSHQIEKFIGSLRNLNFPTKILQAFIFFAKF